MPNEIVVFHTKRHRASGVALATEQVAASNFTTGLGYDTGGSVFYHGLFLGLDFAY